MNLVRILAPKEEKERQAAMKIMMMKRKCLEAKESSAASNKENWGIGLFVGISYEVAG